MSFVQPAITMLTLGSLLSVLTLSLNFQYARAGMINFGVVAYFAIGAYVYAIVTKAPPGPLDQYIFGFDQPWWLGVVAATLASALFASLTGWPTLRLRGEYLALTTFAFAEIVHALVLNVRAIGNGSVGLTNIKRPDLSWAGGHDQLALALTALVLMIATAAIFHRILSSPFGRALDAIRDDELGAQVVGKRVARMRFETFIFSALPMGLVGSVYAMYTTLVAPNLFTAEVTFFVWIGLVLGGERTLLGSIIGTFVIVVFQNSIGAISFESARIAQLAASAQAILTGLLFLVILRTQPFRKLKLKWTTS